MLNKNSNKKKTQKQKMLEELLCCIPIFFLWALIILANVFIISETIAHFDKIELFFHGTFQEKLFADLHQIKIIITNFF